MTVTVAWVAITFLIISFFASGTGTREVHYTWGRRFGWAGIFLTIASVILFGMDLLPFFF